MYNVEEYIIAPMLGYKDRWALYDASILKGKLNQIKVPTFYLHAWDDFIVEQKNVPCDEI